MFLPEREIGIPEKGGVLLIRCCGYDCCLRNNQDLKWHKLHKHTIESKDYCMHLSHQCSSCMLDSDQLSTAIEKVGLFA